MENLMRLFFWICIVFANLEANSLHLSDAKTFYIRKHVTCPSNATFHAPTNVKTRCISTALNCCLRELDEKVKEACSDGHGYIDYAVEFLNGTIEELQDSHPTTNSSQCACESWPKAHLSEFLSRMESLLQLLNSEAAL